MGYHTAFSILAITLLAVSLTGTRAAPPADPSREILITNLGPGEFALTSTTSAEVGKIATIAPVLAEGEPVRTASFDQGIPFALSGSVDSDHETACLSIPHDGPVFTRVWNGFHIPRAFRTGSFRLVVRPCSDGASDLIAGPPFKMPPKPEMLPRWRATSDVVKANTAKLELNAGLSSDAEQLAGFRIVPGSKRALSPTAQVALLGWLRSEHGFTDNVARRCRAQRSYGFLLEQDFPGRFEGSAEVAVDLHCNTLVLRRFTPDGRTEEHYSVFDHSRDALTAIIDQMFTDQ